MHDLKKTHTRASEIPLKFRMSFLSFLLNFTKFNTNLLESPLSHLETKHQLYKEVGLIGKALGHEVRLELIELLAQCPQSVEKLTEILHEDYKSISAHLRVLYRAGLVDCIREGRYQRYYLTSPKVAALAVMLRETAEQSIRTLTTLERENGIVQAALGVEDAVHYASQGKLILIDVRPEAEFVTGHLPHAINMPVDQIPQHISELPDNVTVAAYCRGPYCFLAHEAARIFAEHGRRLQIIPEGVMEWASHGAQLERQTAHRSSSDV